MLPRHLQEGGGHCEFMFSVSGQCCLPFACRCLVGPIRRSTKSRLKCRPVLVSLRWHFELLAVVLSFSFIQAL